MIKVGLKLFFYRELCLLFLECIDFCKVFLVFQFEMPVLLHCHPPFQVSECAYLHNYNLINSIKTDYFIHIGMKFSTLDLIIFFDLIFVFQLPLNQIRLFHNTQINEETNYYNSSKHIVKQKMILKKCRGLKSLHFCSHRWNPSRNVWLPLPAGNDADL